MSSVKVLFFATLRDKAGVRSTEMEISSGTTILQLKAILVEQFPNIDWQLMEHCLASINHEYRFDEDEIPAEAEIAFFPPVSGGMGRPTITSITEDEIDLNSLLDAITLTSTGAAAIFTGMVRGITTRDNPHETTYLEYEAYKPMAEAKMNQVADEIRAKWPVVEGIAIVQRIGKLYPRTPTVLIACTAAHRDTGVFEAARYGIDRLKEIVPVWKKEFKPDGEEWVEGEYHPRPGE
ncbi:MAG: molybdopterin converting factor [Chloroflexi bacterium HGW-Chloroflexi-6]|nr:MAG: molybdopterin converting factor [Chloroflexi bacterium HGW-Chloroflexi-6]